MEENKDLNEQSTKEISNASEVASKPENKPEKKKKKVGKILFAVQAAEQEKKKYGQQMRTSRLQWAVIQ